MEWAYVQGIHVTTAYRYREGTLPITARKVGQLILVSPRPPLPPPAERADPHARVSSHDQKADLDRQAVRRSAWAAQDGLPVIQDEAEAGPGMNSAGARVRRLLADPAAIVIVVEHHDRLGGMNTELAEAARSAHGRRLIVLDGTEVTDNLVRDMIEVLTSFCARMYDRRSARNRALKTVGCGQRDVGLQAVLAVGVVPYGGGG